MRQLQFVFSKLYEIFKVIRYRPISLSEFSDIDDHWTTDFVMYTVSRDTFVSDTLSYMTSIIPHIGMCK